MDTHSQPTVKASTGADILAYITHVLGYRPDGSLVCVSLCGTSLGATLRLDLPRPVTDPGPGETRALADILDYIRQAASTMAVHGAADGCLLAVFGAHDWLDSAQLPHAALLAGAARAVEAAGLPLRDAWYVGPGYWRSIACRDRSCCPFPGHSNEQIAASHLNAEFVFRGRALTGHPGEAVPALIAVRDAAAAASTTRRLPPLLARLARTALCANQLPLTLAAWDHALGAWPCRPAPALAAFLVASVHQRVVRDAVLATLAGEGKLAVTALSGVGALAAPTAHPVLPPPSGAAFRAVQVPAPAPGPMAGGPDQELALAAYAEILQGGSALAGEEELSSLRPDWQRLDRAEALVLALIREVTGPARSPLLGALAWLQWCRGRGTWAGTYLQLAREADPAYPAEGMWETLLDSGSIALWARHPLTSWPGYAEPATGGGEGRDGAGW